MSLRANIATYVAHLDAQGIHPLTSAPLLYRILWALGVPAAPPLSNSFAKNFVLTTPIFTLSIGTSVHFAGLPARMIERFGFFEVVATCAVVFGTMLGLMVAAYFAWRRRGLDLPAWN